LFFSWGTSLSSVGNKNGWSSDIRKSVSYFTQKQLQWWTFSIWGHCLQLVSFCFNKLCLVWTIWNCRITMAHIMNEWLNSRQTKP
jgi:hypothetical protein